MSTDSLVVINTKKKRDRERDREKINYRQAFQERERKVHKHLAKMHKVKNTIQKSIGTFKLRFDVIPGWGTCATTSFTKCRSIVTRLKENKKKRKRKVEMLRVG